MVMKETYKNRYGDVFTFTLDENNDILWEGNFQYCRFGMPNDYTIAYAEYLREGGDMEIEEFKTEVHKYDDKKREYVYDKYNRMVKSIEDKIDMVDPSGGPYISVETPLDNFGFEGYVAKGFEKIPTGYKIITNKYHSYYEDKYKPGNIFTFTKDDKNDILWEGDFSECAKGIYNNTNDGWNAFKRCEIIEDEDIGFISCCSSFDGASITIGKELDSFGFKGYVVKEFEKIETGYKIVTEKCPMCNLAGGVHKMGCETRKVQVHIDMINDNIDEFDDNVKRFYEQMEKEVHYNRSNLNK